MNTEDNSLVTDEMENSEMEPVEESEIEEPSQEEETTEDNSQDEPSEELILNKFRSKDDAVEGYVQLEKELGTTKRELAQLRKELEESRMSPEEKEQKELSRKFLKENNVLTREEFEQIQRDEREANALISKGATPKQIERVKRISQYGDYAKMSITEVYKDLFGGLPGKAPTRSVAGKGVQRTGQRTITRSKFNSLKVGSPEFNEVEQKLYKGELKLVD